MIYGIGTDIIHVERIKKIIDKHKNGFIDKIFTEKEIEESKRYNNPSYYFAGRWAVKEALSKALGTGIGEKCNWLDIETQNKPSGAPECFIRGKAKKTIEELSINKVHVSISHDKHYASANVILEQS